MFLNNKFILVLLLLSGFTLLSGCVALNAFPGAARSGDTITLAVGSADGMKKTNTTATYVSDVDGSSVVLPIRAIVRLRPDQTSSTALFDGTLDTQVNYTGHAPWLSVIVIDLPVGLTVGLGQIDIVSSASYGTLTKGINDIPVKLEIIAGIGEPNYFWYDNGFGGISGGSLGDLEALPQVVIQPPIQQVSFGAAEIKVNVPTLNPNTGLPVPTQAIRVVADDFYTRNARDQVQMNWSRNGDEFAINFISPKAQMRPMQLRFSIVVDPPNTFVTVPGPGLVSVKLYDIDGNPITLGEPVPDVDLFTIGLQ